jgi:hypothetical protein
MHRSFESQSPSELVGQHVDKELLRVLTAALDREVDHDWRLSCL